jgi:shikimate kinase
MIIIGNRCVGKTTYGRNLATLLDLPFVDSDDAYCKVHGILPKKIVLILMQYMLFLAVLTAILKN